MFERRSVQGTLEAMEEIYVGSPRGPMLPGFNTFGVTTGVRGLWDQEREKGGTWR